MKAAKKLKVLAENQADDLEMPVTRPVDKPTITAEHINCLIEEMEDLHDLRLMAIRLFCATCTSERPLVLQ